MVETKRKSRVTRRPLTTLALLRRGAGMTLADVAQKAECSIVAVWEIETRKRFGNLPTSRTPARLRIAKLFACPPADLDKLVDSVDANLRGEPA